MNPTVTDSPYAKIDHNPFSGIREIIPKLDGWCSVDKALALASAVVSIRPNISTEVGVYGGRGTIALALAHRYIGQGKVIAIDPFSNEAATEGYEGVHKEWWGKQQLDAVMAGFLRAVEQLKLGDYVDFRRAKSDDVEPASEIGVLVVDGQHSMQALTDVKRYATKVPTGGFCLLDDEEWVGGGPKAASQWLLSNGFVRRYGFDTGGMYQRVRKGKQ
jgi:hypothetical protein